MILLPVTKGYFLRNLLMSENNELKNRYMHIRWEETTHSDGKQTGYVFRK